jgi:hypothetical protein
MKQIITLVSILTVFFALSYCTDRNDKAATTQNEKVELTDQELIEKGKYLVMISGCHDCHSPKRMTENGILEIIEETALSGFQEGSEMMKPNKGALKDNWVLMHPDLTQYAGPWGVSFAANITSDATGIGTWTEEQFMRAMKQGKYKGLENSRMLLPPMPWFNFVNAKDEDLKAMFRYLKSTKPVRNLVPPPIPPDEM